SRDWSSDVCSSDLARAQAHEGDAVAVARVHVGLDLEHEAGELRFVRIHGALARRARLRAGCMFGEGAQQLLHAEVADGRAGGHRRLPGGELPGPVERRGPATSNSVAAPCTSSTSSRKAAARSPRNSVASVLARPSMVRLPPRAPRSPGSYT